MRAPLPQLEGHQRTNVWADGSTTWDSVGPVTWPHALRGAWARPRPPPRQATNVIALRGIPFGRRGARAHGSACRYVATRCHVGAPPRGTMSHRMGMRLLVSPDVALPALRDVQKRNAHASLWH